MTGTYFVIQHYRGGVGVAGSMRKLNQNLTNKADDCGPCPYQPPGTPYRRDSLPL